MESSLVFPMFLYSHTGKILTNEMELNPNKQLPFEQVITWKKMYKMIYTEILSLTLHAWIWALPTAASTKEL